MEWAPSEKRIGKRRQVRSIPMAWCRDPNNPTAYDAESSPDGRIVELSVSGAGFVAITHPVATVGDRVIINCVGVHGVVIVRRIDPDVYPGESYYGVEFADPNGILTTTLTTSFLAKVTNGPDVYVPQG